MNTDQLSQWGEHVAASWFIKEGYNVLFPRSKNHADYDFVIENGGLVQRVQVKAGSASRYGRPRTHCAHKSNFDLLFAVHIDGYARLYPKIVAPTDIVFTDEFLGRLNQYTIQL